ncbi:MAG: DUF3127 domain-containing protein [Bacteroidia bacterium]
MVYTIRGRLYEVFSPVQVTQRFVKQELVLQVDKEYLRFELHNQGLQQLQGLAAGQEVEIHFRLQGRKWLTPQGEVKYLVSLVVETIQPVEPLPSASSEDFWDL